MCQFLEVTFSSVSLVLQGLQPLGCVICSLYGINQVLGGYRNNYYISWEYLTNKNYYFNICNTLTTSKEIICMIREIKELSSVEYLILKTKVVEARPFTNRKKYIKQVSSNLAKDISFKGKDKAVNWFVYNVVYASKRNAIGFSVPLNKEYWTGNVSGIGARKVREVLFLLEEHGYIDIYRGFSNTWGNGDIARHTIVVLKESVVEFVNPPEVDVDSKLLAPVRFKNRETNEQIEFEYDKLEEVTKQVLHYNEHLSYANIVVGGNNAAYVEYFRSFLCKEGEDISGGRYYAAGGGVQTLPQRIRGKDMLINGDKIIELDYSALHPRMLYESIHSVSDVEIDVTLFDPYNLDIDYIKIDVEAINSHKLKYSLLKYEPLRNLIKYSLLVALNCKDRISGVRSVNSALRDDKRKTEVSRKYVGLGTIDVNRLFQDLATHNHLIEDKFFNDYGVKLQFIDSMIAERVINAMIQADEVVLCYHDSFIVREGAKKLLQEAMEEAWEYVLGSKKFCKVDEK